MLKWLEDELCIAKIIPLNAPVYHFRLTHYDELRNIIEACGNRRDFTVRFFERQQAPHLYDMMAKINDLGGDPNVTDIWIIFQWNNHNYACYADYCRLDDALFSWLRVGLHEELTPLPTHSSLVDLS